MNKVILISLVIALSGARAEFVTRVGSDFITSGDLDGDGDLDLVLVDGANGTVATGYQKPANTYGWTDARPLGVANIADIGCGNIINSTQADLSLTAPELNRVISFELSSLTTLPAPTSTYPASIGPTALAPIDIGGAGNTAHDDLLVASSWNGAQPFKANRMRAAGGPPTNFGSSFVIASQWRVMNAIEHKPGQQALALLDGSNNLRLYSLASGSFKSLDSIATGIDGEPVFLALIPPGASHALFPTWKPNASILHVFALTETSPGSFELKLAASHDLGAGVKTASVVKANGIERILITLDGGARAELHDMDAAGGITLSQTISPPKGERLIGATQAGSNGMMELSSASGTLAENVSATLRSFSGGEYQKNHVDVIRAAESRGPGANVMTFDNEPFVDAEPKRRQTLRAGDWSVGATIGANVDATYETDQGALEGLGQPRAGNLGAPSPSAAFTLVNQYHPAISLRGFEPALGEQVSSLRVEPPPGTYGSTVFVTLTSSPAAPIHYRADSTSDWTLYSGPIPLFANTDLRFFARSGSRSSNIRSASYRFTDPLGSLDSDGDGVPDFVELAHGLDPIESGLDGDEDGYSDLDELLAGSVTTNGLSVPANSNRAERAAIYDQIVTTYGFDGRFNVSQKARSGTQLRAFSASGGQLGYAENETLAAPAGVTNPAARFAALPTTLEPPFLTVATTLRFRLLNTPVSSELGTELLGLFPTPEPEPIVVSHAYANGSLGAEAAGWVDAARDARINQTRVIQMNDLNLTNTLAALLVERKCADELFDRGTITNQWVSLFKGRSGDAAMEGLTRQQLLSLRRTGPSNEPAFLPRQLVDEILADTRTRADLLAVATAVYDVRSQYGASPSNHGKLPLPVDELRAFILSGELSSNYLAYASISANQLSNAVAEVALSLAAPTARPVEQLTLETRANSFAGACPVLYTAGGTPKSLYAENGAPFRFPITFALPAGSTVFVEGFSDRSWNLVPSADPLEVISLALTAIPTPSGVDADGDLIADDYEALFLAGSDGDLDDDGRSDLQEYLDGTDPADPTDHAPTIADLGPPMVTLVGDQLNVDWPSAYAEDVVFTVEFREELNGAPFATERELPEGALSATLDLSAEKRFYRARLNLR